ncbi:hypothetical protein J3F83DRAFT_720941 [Trichoderma novae-zelandiae]
MYEYLSGWIAIAQWLLLYRCCWACLSTGMRGTNYRYRYRPYVPLLSPTYLQGDEDGSNGECPVGQFSLVPTNCSPGRREEKADDKTNEEEDEEQQREGRSERISGCGRGRHSSNHRVAGFLLPSHAVCQVLPRPISLSTTSKVRVQAKTSRLRCTGQYGRPACPLNWAKVFA